MILQTLNYLHMNLIPTEQSILTSEHEEVMLTNLRVSIQGKSFFGSSRISVFLEDIASIEKAHQFDSSFLKFVIYTILFGFAITFLKSFHKEELQTVLDISFIISTLAFFIGIILFLISKRKFLRIETSGGEKFNINLQKMSDINAEEFIATLIETKFQRINQLHNTSNN